MCAMFQMGTHSLCWCGERFCLWDLSGINFFSLLSLYPLYLYLLYFVTILCAFFVNYSSPQIRNTCAPNLGRWGFYGKEFYAHFSFHNMWCFRSNCLFIKCMKLCLCFEKFYNIFLSLRAVKKPPHIRRLSCTNYLFQGIKWSGGCTDNPPRCSSQNKHGQSNISTVPCMPSVPYYEIFTYLLHGAESFLRS